MKRHICFIVAVLGLTLTAHAQGNDFGMWYEIGAEKKLSSKWSLGVEGEFRTRNNTKTADRWSAGLSGEYKISKVLKVSAGYLFLYDNNMEEFDLKKDGFRPNKWTPSYWGVRHRFNLSLSGNVDWGRFNFALRERWQYTYRPAADGKKYDFDEEAWTSVRGKGKNVLRSSKTRYQVGVDYKYKKKHVFSLTYRYQDVNSNDDDSEVNSHLLGLSYKYKF